MNRRKEVRMGLRIRVRGLVLLVAVAASLVGAMVLFAAPRTEAARCCGKAMYCTVSPPIVCWEVCLPCR